MYSIRFHNKAVKQLKKIPRKTQINIMKVIEQLKTVPKPRGSKLKGEEAVYRVRCGDYRIIYDVVDKDVIIFILRIGHRREIYKKL